MIIKNYLQWTMSTIIIMYTKLPPYQCPTDAIVHSNKNILCENLYVQLLKIVSKYEI